MIKAGTQLWNEDKTQGYEFLIDIYGEIPSAAVKPLGDAPEPIPHTIRPHWLNREIKRHIDEQHRDR